METPTQRKHSAAPRGTRVLLDTPPRFTRAGAYAGARLAHCGAGPRGRRGARQRPGAHAAVWPLYTLTAHSAHYMRLQGLRIEEKTIQPCVAELSIGVVVLPMSPELHKAVAIHLLHLVR